MTILHPAEVRDMTPAERQAELEDLETELLNAQAVKAAGGMPDNPGRIPEMRKAIARLKTIQREEGDLEEDIDEEAVEQTETVTGGLFGRGGDDEAEDDEADAVDAEDAAEADDETDAAEETDEEPEEPAAEPAAADDGGDDTGGDEATEEAS